jgi:uncharacterized protein YkwD
VSAATSVCDAPAGSQLEAMNRDRRANGRPDLCADAQLGRLAQDWANRMAEHRVFQHQDLAAVITTTPFTAMAENILSGAADLSVDEMEALWMGSPGHRDHILDARYRAAGVGTAVGADGRVYAVVDFGG